MNAQPDSPLAPFSDEEREAFIERLRQLGLNRTESGDARKLAFALMAELANTRSDTQVRKMEMSRFGRVF